MSTVRKLSRTLLVASSLLLCAQAQAQTLVYALSYAETPASFRRRFPHGAFGATTDDQLAMLRAYRKTEISSVSMIDGKRSPLFSDEELKLEITPTGATLGAGKAYARGVVREWRTTPNPGAASDTPAVYEVSLDGSKRFRRLYDIQPNQTPALPNPQATRAVFGTFVNEKFTVFIYELPAWKLVRSWELTSLTQAHCPDCIPTSLGWLADGNRLFVNLDLGGGDYDEVKNHDIPGTYFTGEDGTDLGGIPVHAGQLQLPGYVREQVATPYLIGQLPDGNYLFRDYGLKKGPLPKAPIQFESFLVIDGSDFKSERQIPLHKLGLGSFYLSHTGKYLAYVEDRQTPNYRAERHVWGLDLESGAEKELLVTPPPSPPTSPEPNVIFTVLGWVDNN
jgi:hypothetical protein